jgi:hypothetical protein
MSEAIICFFFGVHNSRPQTDAAVYKDSGWAGCMNETIMRAVFILPWNQCCNDHGGQQYQR